MDIVNMLCFKYKIPLLSTFYLTEGRMVRQLLLFRFINSVGIPHGGLVLTALYLRLKGLHW